MINYASVTGENKSRHNLNWPYIPGQLFTVIIIIANSGSGKINALLNLINKKNSGDYDTNDKIYFYVKDPNEVKCQHLIAKRENIGLE